MNRKLKPKRLRLTPEQAFSQAKRQVKACMLCGSRRLAYLGCLLEHGVRVGLFYGV